MRTPYKRYLRTLAAVTVVSLVLVALFNVVIDPFGAYRIVNIPALHDYKSEVCGRIGKAETIRHGKWDVIVLGSSRAQIGVDPYNSLWGDQVPMNAALGGTNLHETLRVLDYTLSVASPKKVILLVDFVMFDGNLTCRPRFLQSRFNDERSLVEYHLGNLIGGHATSSSWEVLMDCARSKGMQYDDRGYEMRYHSWYSIPPRHRFRRLLTNFIQSRYPRYTYSRQRVDSYRQIVATCLDKGVELTVAVTPVHALQLEAIRRAGLWDDFEQFKRDLVQAAAEQQAARDNAPPVAVWDFTGYAGLVAEPLPPEGDTTPMKWYWECSHFNETTGSLVLRRILHLPMPDEVDADGFGARMTPANVEQHLADIRQQREPYVVSRAEDVALVDGIAAKYMPDSSGTSGQDDE